VTRRRPALCIVRCEPSGREVWVATGTTLLEAVVMAALPLARSCDGRVVCALCRVQVLAGTACLSPAAVDEQRLLAARGAGPEERLACCARVDGAVTVTTTYW
jgi:ferredoxin